MLKGMIVSCCLLATSLTMAPAIANSHSPPITSPRTSAPTTLLNLSQDETQNLARDAANFVNKRFVTDSWLGISERLNAPPEILSDALAERMIITGKWSRIVHGIFVESGIILGQSSVTAFVVRDARQRVLAVGGISVGSIGINDGNPLDATDPNEVAIFYRSRADLQTALPQINGFARFYIKSFIDPSSPETNPPPTYIETQYDLGRCGAGKSGKHIDVKTCPKQVKTLPVK